MKIQDKINMILLWLVISLGFLFGWSRVAKGNHGGGLTKSQIEALTQACLIRAYEMRLQKTDRIAWCSCIIINLDAYFKTQEPVFEERLWDEVYMKCAPILQKST